MIFEHSDKGGSMNKHFHHSVALFVFIVSGLLPALRPASADSSASDRSWGRDRPGRDAVVVALTSPLVPGIWFLESGAAGEHIPAQIFEDANGAQLATVLPPLAAGSSHTYTLNGPVAGSGGAVSGVSFERKLET